MTLLGHLPLAGCVALLLACPAAIADLRKCVGADGRVSYTDKPCAAGATPAAFRRPLEETPPGQGIQPSLPNVTMSFYDVEGYEYEALSRSLTAGAKGGFRGWARWNVSYRYETRMEGGRCSVSRVSPALTGTIQMPRWVLRAGASPALVARWQRYEAALLLHEEGHIDTGRELARVLESEFRKVPAAADCGALDHALRQRFNELVQEYRERDREYDRRTGHGRTQGASFEAQTTSR